MRLAILIVLVMVLTSCNYAQVPTRPDNVAKWTDPETGCVYLVYGAGAGNATVGSLSIRFMADGKADCPGNHPVQAGASP